MREHSKGFYMLLQYLHNIVVKTWKNKQTQRRTSVTSESSVADGLRLESEDHSLIIITGLWMKMNPHYTSRKTSWMSDRHSDKLDSLSTDKLIRCKKKKNRETYSKCVQKCRLNIWPLFFDIFDYFWCHKSWTISFNQNFCGSLTECIFAE